MKCISTSDKYNKNSVLSAMERNDCFVRAIASGFEVTYEAAHAFVKDIFKRRNGKGTYGVTFKTDKLSEAFGKSIKKILHESEHWEGRKLKVAYRMRGKWKVGGYTTISFLKKFPKGTYIVLTHNHAFTIKDGIIFGNPEDGQRKRARIEDAYIIGE